MTNDIIKLYIIYFFADFNKDNTHVHLTCENCHYYDLQKILSKRLLLYSRDKVNLISDHCHYDLQQHLMLSNRLDSFCILILNLAGSFTSTV